MAGNTVVPPPSGGFQGMFGGAQQGLFGALSQMGWPSQQASQISRNPFIQVAAMQQAQPQPQNGMMAVFAQRLAAAREQSANASTPLGRFFHDRIQAQPMPMPMPMPPMHADPGPMPDFGRTGGFLPPISVSPGPVPGLKPPMMRADPGPSPDQPQPTTLAGRGISPKVQPMPQPPGFGLGQF